MNELEKDGIEVIKSIIEQSKNDKLTLRRNIISLKFYLLLSGIRTLKFRENIKNKTGNSIFNKQMTNDGREAIDIQQEYIKKIINYYKEWKIDNHNGEFNNYGTRMFDKIDEYIDSHKSIQGLENYLWKNGYSVQDVIFNHVYNVISGTSMVFIKFHGDSLVCSDANSFCEYDDNCPYEVLSFYPISPSIGVILINNYSFIRFKCKSLIFHNELKPNDSIQEYVEQEKINSEILKLSKDIPKDKKIPKDELEFLLYKLQQMIITKYKNLNDKYNYKFKKEWRSTAYFCNAMMMVHLNSIIIYKNINDVKESIKTMNEKKIYRIEDVT